MSAKKCTLQIFKIANLSGEEFIVLENIIGEKFMILCKNIHPWQIEELHSTYITALKKLYKDYNQVYGDPNVELVIA